MISLVLPTYNPGPGVERSVDTLADVLRFRSEPWEVVFACDGCTDGTPARLRELAGRLAPAKVRILEHPINRGKGFAVRAGLLAATGRWRLFTDIDMHFLGGLGEAIDRLRGGADCVIASRTHPESDLVAPFGLLHYVYRRKLQSLAFSKLVRTVLGIPHRDTQAGLKGMTAEVAESVVPRLTCDGFAFDCEFLYAARKLGVTVNEFPIRVWYDDQSSTTGTRTAVRMAGELWRIRRVWKGIPGPRMTRPGLADAA